MTMQESKVRVAVIGVGNCASSFVQGVEFYKGARDDAEVPGLMHVNLGGYHTRDIEFSAAFDVVAGKVGLDQEKPSFAMSAPVRLPLVLRVAQVILLASRPQALPAAARNTS